MVERRLPEVVVTGLGAVTPYGVGIEAFWEGLLAGRPTAGPVTRFDAVDQPVRIACEVPGFDPLEHLPRKLARQTDPFAWYALVAAEEALVNAGLLLPPSGPDGADGPAAHAAVSGVDPDRIGTVVASGSGGLQETTEQHERLRAAGPGQVRPYLTIAMPVNMAGGQIAIRHGLRGPSYAVVSACASGADAIGSAADLIRAGRADVMLAGGAEAGIHPLQMAGFAAAGALSRRNDEPERASRPFDVDRDGFVIGEGAGLLVLERADHAAARGATPLAVLAGYAATNDAYHPARPAPDGRGAVRALALALADADTGVDDVDHLNAHATSTVANDRAEAAAVQEVFGAHADRVAVTSTKSAVGHLLGAAGGVEAVATVQALVHGLVPPSQNLERQDPACALDVVAPRARRTTLRVAISSSFGFGGHNAGLVFRAQR